MSNSMKKRKRRKKEEKYCLSSCTHIKSQTKLARERGREKEESRLLVIRKCLSVWRQFSGICGTSLCPSGAIWLSRPLLKNAVETKRKNVEFSRTWLQLPITHLLHVETQCEWDNYSQNCWYINLNKRQLKLARIRLRGSDFNQLICLAISNSASCCLNNLPIFWSKQIEPNEGKEEEVGCLIGSEFAQAATIELTLGYLHLSISLGLKVNQICPDKGFRSKAAATTTTTRTTTTITKRSIKLSCGQ